MLSVHGRAFRRDEKYGYGEDFFTPGSNLAQERGLYAARKFDTCLPEVVSWLVGEHVWSPIVWTRGKRAEKNFAAALWIALDFDDGAFTLDEAVAEFADYAHVIGTTKSHQKDKGGKVCDRFRVAVRGDFVLTDVADYRRVVSEMAQCYGADGACIDGARFFYPCEEIISAHDGRSYPTGAIADRVRPPIDWMDVARTAKVPRAQPVQPERPFKTFTHTTNHFLTYGAYGEGNRNVTVFKVCCDMFRKGLSDEDIYAAVSGRTDLPQKEIRRCLQSARSQGG